MGKYLFMKRETTRHERIHIKTRNVSMNPLRKGMKANSVIKLWMNIFWLKGWGLGLWIERWIGGNDKSRQQQMLQLKNGQGGHG